MTLRKLLVLTLVLVLTVSGFAYTWGDLQTTVTEPDYASDQMILRPSGTDDPQPDTILYDDGMGNWLAHGVFNFWADVRFTAPVEFSLRSVYIYPNNANNNTTNSMTINICSDVGGNPGSILSTITVPAPIGTDWIDANLLSPITFNAGDNFHVYYNIPGGTFPSDPGWWPRYDSGTTTYRSLLSTNQVTWDPWNSDCLLRVGGVMAGGFLDLATMNVYNTSRKFFMTVNTPVTFKADVENIGINNADNYTFTWVVEDTSGNEVWRFQNAYTNLAGGASVTLTADSAFTSTANGYYYVWGTAFHIDDADHSNDTQGLEQAVDSLDVWYIYDDGTGESQFTMDPTDAFGNSFTPTVYPCDVDTVAVMVGDSASCTVKIFQNDPYTGTPVTMVWSTTATLSAGAWEFFAPTDVSIFEGSFTVAVEAVTATTMRMDDGVPNAAGNPNMPTVAWQMGAGTWSPFEGSDLMARAYISPSSATPPDPVIAVSQDTIDFPDTNLGDTSRVDLTIYNVGGGNDLVLTMVGVTPGTHFGLDQVITNYTIPVGDSLVVEARFFPLAAGPQAESIIMVNNTATSPYFVRLFGTGIEAAVGDRPGELPERYELSQNHPNPFNPTTTIEFSIPQAGNVELAVFNVLGSEVARLAEGAMERGRHSVTFDASQLGSGIYFYRLTAGEFTDMKKMVLMK